MKKRKVRLAVLLAALLAACIACTKPAAPAFERAEDYSNWANETGYESGALVQQGDYGIYMNYYHTLPGARGYDSGRIAVGDSRCCQLGIYEQRTGRGDFAAFGVWGGHYREGAYPQIVTDALFVDVERCFRSQIAARGECTIFFFATVNDYDYESGDNSANIAAAVRAAERLASLCFELDGRTFRPRVVIIGFDGCRREGGYYGVPSETFNRCLDEYNAALLEAVAGSEALGVYFTTVRAIAGGNTAYIDDGLHYGDETLRSLADFIAGFAA